MIVYPDSSFLVSGYLIDIHSPEVIWRMASGPTVLVTQFHRAEVANAIFQWVFRGTISASDASRTHANFESDCSSGLWTPIDFPVRSLANCVSLAERRVPSLGVRTLDSLHVAAALELKAERFWTFDRRQARLAEAEGLVTS